MHYKPIKLAKWWKVYYRSYLIKLNLIRGYWNPRSSINQWGIHIFRKPLQCFWYQTKKSRSENHFLIRMLWVNDKLKYLVTKKKNWNNNAISRHIIRSENWSLTPDSGYKVDLSVRENNFNWHKYFHKRLTRTTTWTSRLIIWIILIDCLLEA